VDEFRASGSGRWPRSLLTHWRVARARARSLVARQPIVGLFRVGKLQRLELRTALPYRSATSPGIGFAGSWGESGVILYASVQGEAIYSVPASGGTPEKILEPDAARGEFRVSWPRQLGENRGFLYLGRTPKQTSQLMWMQPGKPPHVVAPLASRFERRPRSPHRSIMLCETSE
jgi:hypothetical protein